jgi:flagellar assembly protein FliH
VNSAREEAAKVMQDAYDQGFAEGEAAGRAQGKGEYEDRIAKLSSLLSTLDVQRAEVLHQHEEDLLQLIKTMVDRLVNHEVSVNPLVIKASLQKAMDFVVENSMVQVHLHGDDFNRIKKLSLEDPALLEGKNRVQLVEDPNISAGGCLLKTDFGEIDATLAQSREKLFALVDQAFMAALADSSG